MTKLTTAQKLYEKAIVNDLLKRIEDLNLIDEDVFEEIKVKLNEKKKRKSPNIAPEKQCTETCKSGDKCKTTACYDSRCWAHLKKDERELYIKFKKESADKLKI